MLDRRQFISAAVAGVGLGAIESTGAEQHTRWRKTTGDSLVHNALDFIGHSPVILGASIRYSQDEEFKPWTPERRMSEGCRSVGTLMYHAFWEFPKDAQIGIITIQPDCLKIWHRQCQVGRELRRGSLNPYIFARYDPYIPVVIGHWPGTVWSLEGRYTTTGEVVYREYRWLRRYALPVPA